jgi:hypothetical protein
MYQDFVCTRLKGHLVALTNNESRRWPPRSTQLLLHPQRRDKSRVKSR